MNSYVSQNTIKSNYGAKQENGFLTHYGGAGFFNNIN
jgi:hypothetical protein